RTLSYPEKELSILSEYSHVSGNVITPNELIAMIREITLNDLLFAVEKLGSDAFSVIRIGK
ncbi:MAG: hypothetical protein KGL39_13565, partial [Patescibacteria group bacterium]|nr:hypothetical protein [Patescibacteria group bacterium]